MKDVKTKGTQKAVITAIKEKHLKKEMFFFYLTFAWNKLTTRSS